MPARLLRPGVWLIVAITLIASLQFLAWRQLRAQLVREAFDVLSPLARGDTPFRWRLDDAGVLVGRRVLGDCAFAFEADALILRRGSRQCEVALELRTPLDLRRFDTLTITAAPSLPAFSLQVREQLSSAQHLTDIAPASAASIALDTLPWRLDSGGAAAAPVRAAMLRLRFADLQSDLRLQEIAVLPRATAGWSLRGAAAATWTPLAEATSALPSRAPLYVLDGWLRPEAVLHARDQLREREPAAIVVFRDDIPRLAAAIETGALPPSTPGTPFYVGLCIVMLALARLGPRRSAAAYQVLAALALPVLLVVGLQIGDDFDRRTWALIGVAVLNVIVLAWIGTTKPWRWSGTGRAWVLALAAPLIAATVALLFGHVDLRAFPYAALPGYLIWALAQQYLICTVVADRLRVAGMPAEWTVLAAATAFALLHSPNAALMLATFLGGLIWGALWLQERSLLPLAASHALASLLLTSGLPPFWLRSAEVSLRYYL